MAGISKINYEGKEIISIDFTGLLEYQMIDLVKKAESFILNEKKSRLFIVDKEREKKLFLLNIKGTSITPMFFRVALDLDSKVKHLSQKSAIVGLTEADYDLLNGFNYVIIGKLKTFETMDGVLKYIID